MKKRKPSDGPVLPASVMLPVWASMPPEQRRKAINEWMERRVAQMRAEQEGGK